MVDSSFFLVKYYPLSAFFWKKSQFLKSVFCILSILPLFYSILTLRKINCDVNAFVGSWWLLYAMILVWCVDSGSYVFGKIFGFKKLSSKISPNKTLEGTIGGFFTSMLAAYLLSRYMLVSSNIFALLICSVLTVLVSILGDLFESMLKRESGKKDSGSLIPGHGGILDRIDSLIPAIPIFLYSINIFNLV